MNVTIKGIIDRIGDVQQFTSGFQKREVLLREFEGNYPQTYPIDLTKDKIDLLDGKNVGDTVTLECNLRANEYNGRHYINLSAWRVG